MNKYYTLNNKLEIAFLGWFPNQVEADKAAPHLSTIVLEDSDLYRFIEQSKAALNHD